MDRKHFNTLVELINKFPQIGERQAQRIAQFIIQQNNTYPEILAQAIQKAVSESKLCPECFIYHEGEKDTCEVCADKERDPTHLTVVEKEADIPVIERSGAFNGFYFVFGSLIPIRFPEYAKKTRLNTLLNRLKEGKIKNVTIALSLHPDANHTTEVISEAVRNLNQEDLSITIPGRGISSGLEFEYADPETVRYAFERRLDIT